jgi:hypothetical protein
MRMIDQVARAQLQLPGELVEVGQQAFDDFFLGVRQTVFDDR